MMMITTAARITAAAIGMTTATVLVLSQQRSTSAELSRTPAKTTVTEWIGVPASVQAEHEAIKEELFAATVKNNKVGRAARSVAKLLEPHLEREERFALPPLGLLEPLARGAAIPNPGAVLRLTDSLRAQMPAMLQEHKAIAAAITEMERRAIAARDAPVITLARRLQQHARQEEEILYPAAILVGDAIRVRQRTN